MTFTGSNHHAFSIPVRISLKGDDKSWFITCFTSRAMTSTIQSNCRSDMKFSAILEQCEKAGRFKGPL